MFFLAAVFLAPACAPPETPRTGESEKQSPASPLPLGSEALAANFPLLPLIEKSLWRELLQAEAKQSSEEASEREAAGRAVATLSEKIRTRHPFKIEGKRLELGGIVADKETGRFSVPALVHYPDPGDERHPGEVELLLCTETGRTHETLFITKTRPLHLELLLHLCGFSKASETGRFTIEVVTGDGTRIPARSLVRAKGNDKMPDPLFWEFSGSDFRDLYAPDLSGDFAIFWHAHDSVLRVADEGIGSGAVKLEAVPHPALKNGDPVVLEMVPP